jgi:hypothetical protein
MISYLKIHKKLEDYRKNGKGIKLVNCWYKWNNFA